MTAELDIEKNNGVYLLDIQKGYHGYVVLAENEQIPVENVKINGNYVGIDERIETECNDFEIKDGTLHLHYSVKE